MAFGFFKSLNQRNVVGRAIIMGGTAFVVLICLLAQEPRAGVSVSETARFPLYVRKHVRIPAGEFVQILLPPLKTSAVLSVRVTIQNAMFNDLNVYVCDQTSLQQFARSLSNNCRGVNKGRGSIQFNYRLRSPENHYLVLDNSYALMVRKKAEVSITATVKLPANYIKELRNGFRKIQEEISEDFGVPEFDISLEPCGEQNAFSDRQGGHITLCSELFFNLLMENLQGALEAIFMHELAHTLLNIWGLPNWDNEETADEFALVMLFWSGRQQSAFDWINYFSRQDSHAEADYVLKYGDRHPLSVQRVRNIERILNDPRPVVLRWIRLVYPRMTKEALRKIIDNPGPYGSRKLARQMLEKSHPFK